MLHKSETGIPIFPEFLQIPTPSALDKEILAEAHPTQFKI